MPAPTLAHPSSPLFIVLHTVGSLPQVIAIEAASPGDFQAIREYVRGDNYRRSFQETGNPDDSVWSCGLSMGLINDCPPCATVVANIVDEAEDIIRHRLPKVLA